MCLKILRVLSGDNQNDGQTVGFIIGRNLAFIHGFQEAGLSFGGCSIDFIRQHDVRKMGPGLN